jgi:exosortase K
MKSFGHHPRQRWRVDSLPRPSPWDLALLSSVLVSAYAMKRYAAAAGADQLDWLLGPTSALVERWSGQVFIHERGTGYFNSDLSLVIAPSCAGTNYLVVAFCMLACGFVPRLRTPTSKIGWLVASALLAYGSTVSVNAIRIAFSMIHGQTTPLGGWFATAELHRALGIAVYLPSLLLLHAAVDWLLGRRSHPSLAFGLPLACYLGLTLLVPLLNGAYARAGFYHHASAVLAGAALVVLSATLLRAGWRRLVECCPSYCRAGELKTPRFGSSSAGMGMRSAGQSACPNERTDEAGSLGRGSSGRSCPCRGCALLERLSIESQVPS